MTSEYSIELQAENIINYKTRQYFNEVLSSYINGNYRSAIVVLWTVTICDLIYKLQELSSIYNDEKAEKILREIERKQTDNPTSPEWEIELIKLIKERTSMFKTYEITHLEALHKQRHLSAHPVLKEDLDLYQPNKEISRAMIRNTLEYILTKPAMASNKIFENLIIDLKEKKDLFPSIDDLKNYITSKYYAHLPDKVKLYIFKHLWKFIFKLNNEQAEENRKINLKALAILYKENERLLSDYIIQEKEFFSSNINLEDGMDIKYLVILCNKYPKIFTLLDNVYKPMIIEKIKQKKSLWVISFFIFNSPNEYINTLENIIGIDVIIKNKNIGEKIINYSRENGIFDKIVSVFIERFGMSASFDDADNSFDALIEPILPFLNKAQFIKLLELIENNNQIYNRGKAYYDHRKIKEHCDRICEGFDYTQFPKFSNSIKEN